MSLGFGSVGDIAPSMIVNSCRHLSWSPLINSGSAVSQGHVSFGRSMTSRITTTAVFCGSYKSLLKSIEKRKRVSY